jgi:DNA-binding MarR family transcriptional regulator
LTIKTEPDTRTRTRAPADLDRETLMSELATEMSFWRGRDRRAAFEQWVRGQLSMLHLHVLTILEAEGALAMSHLADRLDVSVASVTGIVERMERGGLVRRVRGTPEDLRIVRVEMTDMGREVFAGLETRRRAMTSRLLAELATGDLKALLQGFRALHAARLRLHERERSGSPEWPAESR